MLKILIPFWLILSASALGQSYFHSITQTTVTIPSTVQGNTSAVGQVPHAQVDVCSGIANGATCTTPSQTTYSDLGLTATYQEPLTSDKYRNVSLLAPSADSFNYAIAGTGISPAISQTSSGQLPLTGGTLTGTLNGTNATFGELQGAYYVGSGPGQYSSIASAIASIKAAAPRRNEWSGTIIVTAGFVDTITSTLSIGEPDQTTPTGQQGIKVIMMPNSTIVENITNGTPGIVIYNGSSLECLGAAMSTSLYGKPSACRVYTTSHTNVSAMVATQSILNSKYTGDFGLYGVTFVANAGTVGAVADFGATAKPATVENNQFVGGNASTVVKFDHSGTPNFINNDVYGSNTTRGPLVTIQGGESRGYAGMTSELDYEGGEILCPGPGEPILSINGDPDNVGNVGVLNIHISDVHTQVCSATAGTNYITIHNALNVFFDHDQFSAGRDRNVIDVSQSAKGLTRNIFFDDDGVAGGTTWIYDTTANVNHPFPSPAVTIPNYGTEHFIRHDYAGTLISQGSAGGNTPDSFTKVFPDAIRFSNGVSDQAVDLIFGDIYFTGTIKVTITGNTTKSDATGKLVRVYSVNMANGGTINSYASQVTEALGNTPSQVVLGNLSWDSTNSRFRIPISAVNSSSNGHVFTVKVQVLSTGQFAAKMFPNLALSSIYRLSALAPVPTSSIHYAGTLTTTAASSDSCHWGGCLDVPVGAECSAQAQNPTATKLTGVYVPLVAAAGNVVLEHSATAGATFSLFCQY